MALPLRPRPAAATRRLTLISKADLPRWQKGSTATVRRWIEGSGFTARAGDVCLIRGRTGAPDRALVGFAGDLAEDFWHTAALPQKLPEGSYRLDPELEGAAATRFAAAWAIGAYSFDRYRKAGRAPAELVWPAKADRKAVARLARADALVRDLVNTPAEDMGPAELAAAAQGLADDFDMEAHVLSDSAKVKREFPLVHAVGRAAARGPRMIDLRWGDPRKPKLTIVGKGVCFDTGGLDIKPESGMKIMKKDMGGAAHALGLASMIVDAKLPVRLRVLIPAVENSIAGDAMRPLDVIRSRKGLTVEIGNTDAEGRLILADAFALAGEDSPDLMIDFATLTGAARVALGPDLPALFCTDDSFAESLMFHGAREADPMWRLPLWKGYRARLDSKVADLNNVSDGPFAGAITAALFLQEFAPAGTAWAHFDLYAWNPSTRAGRPEGAAAQVLRAVFGALVERFSEAR